MAEGYTNSTTQINLRVRGGSTQPTGSEGLIWVKTEMPVTSWAVSPNAPEALQEGMVWIMDAVDNKINILPKNTIEVFPSGCRICHNGVWETVEAFLFHDGKWTQFGYTRIYIVENGNICMPFSVSLHEYAVALKKENAQLIIDNTAAGYDYFLTTDSPVNMGNYSALCAEAYASANSVRLGVSYVRDDYPTAMVYLSTSSETASVRLDLTAVNEMMYPGLFASTGVGYVTTHVKNMWLEV